MRDTLLGYKWQNRNKFKSPKVINKSKPVIKPEIVVNIGQVYQRGFNLYTVDYIGKKELLSMDNETCVKLKYDQYFFSNNNTIVLKAAYVWYSMSKFKELIKNKVFGKL